VELLNDDILRLQQHSEAAITSSSERSLASCLKEVVSISGDLQQRTRVLLSDFDLQFYIAAKENVCGRRRTTNSEHNDTL